MGGQEKEWTGCLLDDLRAFDINADQGTTVAQDEGEWRKTEEKGVERFTVNWIASEKARGWTTLCSCICPNVTGRTKWRIVKKKRACAGLLAILDQSKSAPTCIFFVVFCFVAVPTATRSWLTAVCVLYIFYFCTFLWRCRFFLCPSIYVPLPFSFMDSTWYVFLTDGEICA